MLLVTPPSLKPGSPNFDPGNCYSILLHSKKVYGGQNYKMLLVLVGVQTQKQNIWIFIPMSVSVSISIPIIYLLMYMYVFLH